MGEAAKKEADEETLVMVGPGAEDLADPRAAPTTTEDDEEETAHEPDARLGAGRDDDDREERERPRESSRERRERQKRANERIRRELEYYKSQSQELAQRIQRLEGRSAHAEQSAAEQRLNSLKSQISTAGRVMAQAMEAAAGGDKSAKADYEQALGIRDELQREYNKLELQSSQQRVEPPASNHQGQAGSPQLDPLAQELGRRWMREHPWFVPSGTDEDSRLVLLVDRSLRERGSDPADDEHWDELNSRLRRLLPHKFSAKGSRRSRDEDADNFDDEEDETASRSRASSGQRSGPRFSSGGRERPLRKGEVYVSAERKHAMQLAGLWDDPQVRQRLLRGYAEVDAQIQRERTGQA